MATSYENYLKRLRGRINQNPYMASARRTAFATTPDKFGDEKFRDAPIGVQAQHDLDKERIRKGIVTDVVERAGVRDIERKQRLGERIDEVQLKIDEAERLRKDKFGDTLLQVGGAVVGAVAGSFVGMPLQGAQLGASAGQLIGGFTGDNSEDIGQGLASGIQTFTQISTDKKMIELGNMGVEAQVIMSGLDEAGGADFLFQWQNAITIEQKRAVIRQFAGQGVLL